MHKALAKTRKVLKGNALRLVIFIFIYLLITLTNPLITKYGYGFAFGMQDSYLLYLAIPLTLILAYTKKDQIGNLKNHKNNLTESLIFGIISIGIAASPIQKVLADITGNLPLSYNLPLITAHIAAAFAIFNTKFLKHFKKEIIIILLAIFLYILFQIGIEKYWMHFSQVILFTLAYTLPLFSKEVFIQEEVFNVQFQDFNVNIGPPCSGIHSMLTFAFLLTAGIIFLSKNNKINITNSLIAIIIGMTATFLLNIIRVNIIILIGGLYSKELAIKLFHEYLGAVFLITLFLIYIYLIIPKLIKAKKQKSNAKKAS